MPRCTLPLAFVVFCVLRGVAYAQTTLNLSQDLTTLGIAGTNMVPNQPSLDAGPLFMAGVNYAKANGISTVVADPGAYYFLSIWNVPGANTHVAVDGIVNMMIDLQGSNLIFAHPLFYGITVFTGTNIVLQNFTVDYQPLPFTQLRVIGVDVPNMQIQYAVQPGYQDPATFNSIDLPPGISTPEIQVHVFRNGRPVLPRLYTKLPFNGTSVSLVNPSVPRTLSAVRPGDVVAISLRGNSDAVVAGQCTGCTLRNITVYSCGCGGGAVQVNSGQSTVLERIYSIPKPGTDRLISTTNAAVIGFSGPNNQIRLSRGIRNTDDAFWLFGRVVGTVQTQTDSRTFTVAADSAWTWKSLGGSVPNGVAVGFENPLSGAILGSAVIASQGTPASTYPYQTTYTFDRDLPGSVVGSVMYTNDANLNGANTLIERNASHSSSCCRGLAVIGLSNGTIRGNYIGDQAWAGVSLDHSMNPGEPPTAPPIGLTLTNNVIDGTNLKYDWWWYEMAAIQSVTLTTAFDLMKGAPFSNLTVTNNFIADSGRSAVWLGNTNGGSITGNYILDPNQRPDTPDAYGSRPGDELRPLVVDTTTRGVSVSNNVIDTTSGHLFVTDASYNELAAYAPGGTVRLNGYGVGGLASPTATLTDADGVTTGVTIQNITSNAIDVQVPGAAGFGGAYITLTSGATKSFATLFVDSQDNIPAVNGCVYEASLASPSVPATASNLAILVVTQPGCAYQVAAPDAWVTPGPGGVGTGVISVGIAANSGGARTTTIEIAGQPFTIAQDALPTMTLDRSLLVFGALNDGTAFTKTTATKGQTVQMTQTGTGTVTWTASANQPWLVVQPTSGSGTVTFTVSTQFVPGLGATQSGSITITLVGAGNIVGPIRVTLNMIAPSPVQPPFGSFDTPNDGTMGVAGSIAVTGWALDDIEVTRVAICRDPVSHETTTPSQCASQQEVFIGDAVFVDGARPDVQKDYPDMPLSSRAGWGYLMLTNFLPNSGNGTFTLRAYAFDAEGLTTALGAKTITCNNAGSLAPFGAIDVPGQGAITSGVVGNTGWVLAQAPNFADPPDGGTVNVFVDGANVGSPVLWNARPDLTGLFPAAQYPGISQALGIFGLDTTALTNGVHTIFWLATGTGGIGTQGIGSRFFTVSNGAQLVAPAAAMASSHAATVIASRSTLDLPAAAASRIVSGETLASEIAAAPLDRGAVQGRRGFDLELPLQPYTPSSGGLDLQAEELDRIELHLGTAGPHQYTGYLQTAGGLKPLPVGSSLDASTGTFTWMPGVGFYGTYHLTFVRWSGAMAVARQDVRITLNAKGSNRIGPQTVIDAPRSRVSIGSPFFVGGWAADLDSTVDTGVNTVHVWAYPLDVHGNRLDPIFIGPAIYGGARPDVAAVYGDCFGDSGYGIIVNGLAPGTYDIAVFAFSTVVNNFAPATVVRITVR
jgi:hypothetical protein